MFAKLYLEITSACNLRCSFCPPTGRPPSFISREDFAFLLGRLRGGGRLLHFHVKGEPLLHPDLGYFLGLAGEAGFGVALATNGSLLSERAELLLAAPSLRKLSVSLHSQADKVQSGAAEPAPASVDGGPASIEGGAAGAAGARAEEDLQAYWRGLVAFLDLHRAKPAFPVSLRLWNQREGCLPPGAARLWELLRGRYPALGPWGEAGAWPADNRLDEGVYLNGAEEFEWPDPALPEGPAEGSCLGLRGQIAVLVDGTVLPCCLDGEGRLALGNLFEAGLEEILATPRARAIREGFERGRLVEGLCRRCGFRRRFGAAKDRAES